MRSAFTLLELLVVIAIIGILSSIVLASVNSARNGAAVQASIQEVSQIRNTAELLYLETSSYNNLCATTGPAYKAWENAVTRLDVGSISFCLSGSGQSQREFNNAGNVEIGTITPVDEPDKWAVNVKTSLSPLEWYCIDYTGYSGITTANTITGAGPDRNCCDASEQTAGEC